MAKADANATTTPVAYVRDMLIELRVLVLRADPNLAYLLDVARAHADAQLKDAAPAAKEIA